MVNIKGPKGANQFEVPEPLVLEVGNEEMNIKADYVGDRDARRIMGTVNAVLTNMVKGVSEGFTKKLILVGVGYRATVQGKSLDLALGFSHPVVFALPEHVNAQVEGNNIIVLSSHDNVQLGQVAANIRALRPPEPYQGKGVTFEGERVRRKAGKTGKK